MRPGDCDECCTFLGDEVMSKEGAVRDQRGGMIGNGHWVSALRSGSFKSMSIHVFQSEVKKPLGSMSNARSNDDPTN